MGTQREKRIYSGPTDGIVCQAGPLGRRCHKQVRPYGSVTGPGKTMLMAYRCPLDHLFAVLPERRDTLAGATVFILPSTGHRPAFGARL